MAQFAVIGLGSFGATVALELIRLNHEVIGVDLEKKYVENIADELTHAVIADGSDEHVLKELNLQNCEAVIVAIGEDIEASILCVLHLKNLGVKRILAKAKTKSHHMILSHLDVTKIIHPEEDMGVRVAQALTYPMVSRYMNLEDDHYVVKVEVPAHMHGVHFLGFLQQATGVNLLLLKRGKQVIYHIDEQFTLIQGDIFVVEGALPDLKQLSKRFKAAHED